MATGTILFDLSGATPGDGTGTGNNPPQATVYASFGTQTANTPKVTVSTWAFDADTDEHIMWTFQMPENYSSGGTLRIRSACVSDQGANVEVIWKAALAAITPDNSENAFSKVFATTATGSAVFSSIESGVAVSTSISPGLDSVAANDMVTLFLGRDADHLYDDVTGDCIALTAALEYTTT